ncbi:M23 family metallopeptidase [Sphingomonas koreensis]|nr:M23 family metallopeptidase [Sphingomonas koreensis]
MSRLGWVILTLIVVGAALFGSMLHFGGPIRRANAPAPSDSPLDPGAPAIAGYPALAVPVQGVRRDQISDNWLDPREGGARQHHGTDIMVPQGTPILAAAPGTIEKMFDSTLGGTTLYERSPDGRWQYYYAHMSGYAPGVQEQQVVKTGDLLGYAGDTGDAGPGNYQLHFGLSYMHPGEGWWQGTPVNPYPLLAGKPVGG